MLQKFINAARITNVYFYDIKLLVVRKRSCIRKQPSLAVYILNVGLQAIMRCLRFNTALLSAFCDPWVDSYYFPRKPKESTLAAKP